MEKGKLISEKTRHRGDNSTKEKRAIRSPQQKSSGR
jgi:hypothetical protein